MSARTLGRLERVGLREAWTSESRDFTPWLAREENLALVGEAIGIELEVESQEKDVGPFRADILCKDTTTDDWVLVENQLERTDHTHLGQVLTYAAGLDAVTIVWIAERFTDEHRAALDWLNEHTDEKINIFGLEIELWRIGESPIAPKFNIISQPNDWARMVKSTAGKGEISAHQQVQLRFWTAFKAYMEAQGSFVRCPKPAPQHWSNHPLGRSGVYLASIISLSNPQVKQPEIRAEVYLDGPNSKEEYGALEASRVGIEEALGFPLTWINPENRAMCRLVTRQNADFTNEALWPGQFDWLRNRLETMHRVFAPIVKRLKVQSEE